jgi:very-short-patch-repair endonuclease
MKLRAHGLTVLRYGSDQVNYEPATVAADVLGQIRQREQPAA